MSRRKASERPRKASGTGLDHIRRTYGVPAIVGARIRFIEADTAVRYGTVVGGSTAYLRVRWDDDGSESDLHPTWHVYYLGEYGEVIWPATSRGRRSVIGLLRESDFRREVTVIEVMDAARDLREYVVEMRAVAPLPAVASLPGVREGTVLRRQVFPAIGYMDVGLRSSGAAERARALARTWVAELPKLRAQDEAGGQRAFAPTAGTLLGAGITAAVASIPAGFGWAFGGGWGSEIADQSIRASRFGPPGKLPSEASREQASASAGAGERAGHRDLRMQDARALRSALLAALAPHAGSTWRGAPLVTFGVHPPTGAVFVSAKLRLDPRVRQAVDRAAAAHGYRLVEARTLGTWSAFVLGPQVRGTDAAAGMLMDRGRAAAPRGVTWRGFTEYMQAVKGRVSQAAWERVAEQGRARVAERWRSGMGAEPLYFDDLVEELERVMTGRAAQGAREAGRAGRRAAGAGTMHERRRR